MRVTVDEIHAALGELPARVIVLIEQLGVDRSELIEARARLQGDDAAEREAPSARVAQLVRLLEAALPEAEPEEV